MNLLLACLRWPHSEACRHTIQSAASVQINWEHFLALMVRHRVFALVQHGLSSADVLPPSGPAAQINALSQRTSFDELRLAAEAERLLLAMREKSITPLVLKGIAVSMEAFGQLGLRFNRDIDVLVKPAEVVAASTVLEAAGYERIEPAQKLGEAGLARWMRGHKDLVYRHPTKGHIVELHWRLFDNPHLLPLKDDVPPAQISCRKDFSIPTLPADTGLLYLCLHGAQHAWSRLKWLADVAALLAKLDASAALDFYHSAERHKLHRAAALAMLLSHDLLGVPIPAEIIEKARADWRIRSLEHTAHHALFDGGSQELEELALGSTRKNLSHYLISDSVRYRLSEFWFDLADGRLDAEGVSAPWAPITRPFRWLARQRRLTR